MPTQKLLLLLALVVVLGGSSVWYLQVLLPTRATDDSFTVEGIKNASSSEVGTSSKPATGAPAKPAAKPVTAAPAATLDANLAAIDATIDAPYDDTALSAEFTTADANTLTDSYDF